MSPGPSFRCTCSTRRPPCRASCCSPAPRGGPCANAGLRAPASPLFAQAAVLAWAHVIASLALLGPADFPDQFDRAGRLGLWAQIALLAGIVAVLILAGARRSTPLAWTGLPIAIAVHTAFLGVGDWRTPARGPGHLVPISLLGFVTALVLLLGAAVWARRPRPED